jgi:hypothetical protein
MVKAKYRDFSNAAGLPYQLERAVPRPGFTRSLASKTVWSQRNHHEKWLTSIGAESTPLNTVAKYY